MTSLKDSLEQYLSEAEQYYTGVVKKDPELKAQRTIGYILSAGGLPLYLSIGHPMSLLPLGAGLFSIVRSYTRRKGRKKKIMSKFEKRLQHLTQEDLEKRISEKDYSLPEPTEQEINAYLAKEYSKLIKKIVHKEKYSFFKYPTEIGGAALGVYGCLDAVNSPYRGAALGIGGTVLFLISGIWKNVQINRTGKRAEKYLREHPEDLHRSPDELYKKLVK